MTARSDAGTQGNICLSTLLPSHVTLSPDHCVAGLHNMVTLFGALQDLDQQRQRIDLGLVYDVKVDGTDCHITMTLTSQTCPEAKTIPDVMKRRVKTIEGIEECEIDIVWEPAWTPQLISEEGRQILGIEDE